MFSLALDLVVHAAHQRDVSVRARSFVEPDVERPQPASEPLVLPALL
jgi:hypothetical protein